jgi:hypothetical protein
MTNPFRDQEKFMKACDQSVTGDTAQFDMYVKLIAEEHKELLEALAAGDEVETLDALIDILVVTIGAIHSMGRKLCVLTLPRLIKKQAKFANVMMVKF